PAPSRPSRAAGRRSPWLRLAPSSEGKFGYDGHMIGRARPAPDRLDHAMAHRLLRDIGGHPHMVEPPPPIRRGPIARAIAPPGIEPLGCRKEFPPDIDPIVRRLQPGQNLALYGRMADYIQKLLVAPHIAF